MDTQRQPPAIEELAAALRPVLRDGLPVSPNLADDRLLGLRGVVARAVDRDDRLNRIKALDGLLKKTLVGYPDDTLGEAARILFGLAPGTRGQSLTERREKAAAQAGYEADHFRKRIEPKVVKQIAWALHQDSQNYIPRERPTPGVEDPLPLEASGDTPVITAGDVLNKEENEHQEVLSQLWAHVYNLRSLILKVERLKVWPNDNTEPENQLHDYQHAKEARDREVHLVKVLIERYLDRYGEMIGHGEGEYSARSMLRLAGWKASM